MTRRLFARRAPLWQRPGALIGVGVAMLVAWAISIAVTIDHDTGRKSAPPKVAMAKNPPAPSVIAKAAMPKPVTPTPQTDYDREAAMDSNALMLRWAPQVKEAAKRLKVPEDWIWAVMQMESGGRTLSADNQPITSAQGAMGIMQVLPAAYNDMRAQYRLGDDPYEPHDNIIAGTAYLKFLYGKYGNPGMFAAYNDGPGNLEAFLNRGRALPEETQDYVSGVAKILGPASPGLSKLTHVELTRPDGSGFEIDTRTVTGVRAAFDGEYAPGVRAVIHMGKKAQGVREDVAAVTAMLNAHGGKF